MTDQEINVAIAEACGWHWNDESVYSPAGGRLARYHPMVPFRDQLTDLLPDYPNDLNAMHESEKVLTPDQCRGYHSYLVGVIKPTCGWDSAPDQWNWHATARQRAEAFLRTLGKWRE